MTFSAGLSIPDPPVEVPLVTTATLPGSGSVTNPGGKQLGIMAPTNALTPRYESCSRFSNLLTIHQGIFSPSIT